MVGMVLPSVGGISTHVKVILSGSQPTAVFCPIGKAKVITSS